MTDGFAGPTSNFFYSQRLRLHYLDWGNPDKPLMLLVHGVLDQAHGWDRVAAALRDSYHVVALDLRGHGDSDWLVGGTYSVMDTIVDIHQLLKQLNTLPVTIVAHSFGGNIALLYAGAFPENVARVVAAEGFGPTMYWARGKQMTPAERIRGWVTHVHDLGTRQPKPYQSVDEAIERSKGAFPNLTPEQLRQLTVHSLRRREDGTYGWKYDNYVRAVRMEYPYASTDISNSDTIDIWSRVACPVLLISGAESRGMGAASEEQVQMLPNATHVVIPKAGHRVHHDQFDLVVKTIREFLGLPAK